MADDSYLNRLKDYSKKILAYTPASPIAEVSDARNRKRWMDAVESGETELTYAEYVKSLKKEKR